MKKTYINDHDDQLEKMMDNLSPGMQQSLQVMRFFFNVPPRLARVKYYYIDERAAVVIKSTP